MSIEIKELSKSYGEQMAVNKVSFRVEASEILGFLGPNGAGKSTTMKMICGVIPPSSGSFKVCGLDMEVEPIATRRKIGYLPESNPLYFDMYVREYLEFVGKMQGLGQLAKKRVAQMIDRTGLGLEQKKKIGQLSKGYKQRVGLAQAMLHEPEVLILDEPTSGLDANQIVEIRSLIESLGKEKTVMLSTHIMQEVEMLCERVIIIDRGEIKANDKVGALKKMMKGKDIVFLQTKETLPSGTIEEIQGVDAVEDLGSNRLALSCSPNADPREAIFHLCREKNWVILEMTLKENSLEQVFQEITKTKLEDA